MNRETGIIEAIARKELFFLAPNYLISGFMLDGYRGIPYKFVKRDIICRTEKDLMEHLEEFSFFRVFSVNGEINNEAYWRDRAKAKSRDKTETEERALYEKLKAKYGQL